MPCRASGIQTAKPDRMDEAQRRQSDLDPAALRAKSPSLIGTALYGAVRRDAKQVAATTSGRRSLCGTRGWLG